MAVACGGCAGNALWGLRPTRSGEEETRAPALTLEVGAGGPTQDREWQPPHPLPASLIPASVVCAWDRQRNSQEPAAKTRGGDGRKEGND